jgi:heme iron utilization protein
VPEPQTEKRDVLQQVTPEVVAEARALAVAQRHAALATLDPTDGHPVASRVNIATGADGVPLILVSGLSPHTVALRADPRCSLLVGEVGKGDPIAHPRLTLRCRAEELARGSNADTAARAQWLGMHPKSKLYIDLPDFAVMQLIPERVNFVAGFGRAYVIDGAAYLD